MWVKYVFNLHAPDIAFYGWTSQAPISYLNLYSLNGKKSYRQILCEVSKPHDWR